MSGIEIKDNNENEFDDQIDIKLYFQYILKNKNKVIYISALGILSSLIYILTAQKIWQGQFQIVLEKPNNQSNDHMVFRLLPMFFFV